MTTDQIKQVIVTKLIRSLTNEKWEKGYGWITHSEKNIVLTRWEGCVFEVKVGDFSTQVDDKDLAALVVPMIEQGKAEYINHRAEEVLQSL